MIIRFAVAALLALLCAGSAFAEQEIKIGVLFPLTGAAASSGSELKAGAELAAEIVNGQHQGIDLAMAKGQGIKSMKGAKLVLIFKDHEGNPTLGADLAKKLILDDKVNAVMGCFQSGVTKAVSAVCEQYGVPMINDSSTSPGLTRQGFKWFWRTTPHDEQFTADLFEFMKGMQSGKVKGLDPVPAAELAKLGVACEKTEWGSSVKEQIEVMAPKNGFEVVKSLLYADKSADLSSEVRSLLAPKPTALLFASYGSDAILMVNTLKAQRAAPKLVWGQNAGFEAPDFAEKLGDTVNGILTRTVFLPKLAGVKPVAATVNTLYRQKTNKDMIGAASRAFTGVQALAAIFEKAGSTKPEDFQKAANSIEIAGSELVMPWKGIKFATSGEDLGQNVWGSGMIGQYQKDAQGKMNLEIVYPFDLATAKMIYPFPGYAPK